MDFVSQRPPLTPAQRTDAVLRELAFFLEPQMVAPPKALLRSFLSQIAERLRAERKARPTN